MFGNMPSHQRRIATTPSFLRLINVILLSFFYPSEVGITLAHITMKICFVATIPVANKRKNKAQELSSSYVVNLTESLAVVVTIRGVNDSKGKLQVSCPLPNRVSG